MTIDKDIKQIQDLLRKQLPSDLESPQADSKTEGESEEWDNSQREVIARAYEAHTIYENNLRQIEINQRQQELDQSKDEHRLRKDLSSNLFIFICIWLAIVLLIVISVASGCLHLSDQVLITLLTSTTITVFGLFATVLKYMFGVQQAAPTSKTKKKAP